MSSSIYIIPILLIIIIILIIYNRKLTLEKNKEKEKEEKYKQIIEKLPGFAYICEYNENWTMKYLSAGFKTLTGYDPSNFIDDKLMSFTNIISSTDRESVWNNVDIELQQLKSFELEYRIKTSSEDEVWVWEKGTLIKNSEDSQNKYLIGIILDINDKKIAQKQLTLNEFKYRNIFEQAEICLLDKDLSLLIKKLEELKLQGIIDPKEYFTENKELTLELFKSIKINDVNLATLKMFNANNKQELIDNIDKTFTENSFNVFIDELCAIWNYEEYFYQESQFKTIDGKDIYGILSFKIPKYEEYFKDVPISIIDITTFKKSTKSE